MTVLEEVTPRAAPGTYPVPAGRARWRFTAHRRQFAAASWQSTLIAELPHARQRSVTLAYLTPTQVQFVLDGHDPQAALLTELATDVICWRWDDTAGYDVAVCRVLLDHSQDVIDESSHTVTFTGHDYVALLQRRFFAARYGPTTQLEQDSYVQQFLNLAQPAAFAPGCYLPLVVRPVNPDGTLRATPSGQLRDRDYPASYLCYTALDDLAKVINGFDYDVQPGAWTGATADSLRIFYPAQGVARTDVQLMYGANVAALQRSVDSSTYTNYWRAIGNNGSSDPNVAQLYGEAWNSDSNNVTVNPVGLWQNTDNAADVTIAATLTQKAQGDLDTTGVLIPVYTATLRPGAYTWAKPNIGDTVPFYAKVGRLNVNTTIRVLGLAFAITDDGAEDVTLTLGASPLTLADLYTQADRDVDALTRR